MTFSPLIIWAKGLFFFEQLFSVVARTWLGYKSECLFFGPLVEFVFTLYLYPARARSARARRACALRALGLLLADGTPTGGRGEDFLSRQPDFFTETAVTQERKVEKSFPRWEINRHDKG